MKNEQYVLINKRQFFNPNNRNIIIIIHKGKFNTDRADITYIACGTLCNASVTRFDRKRSSEELSM